MFNPGGNDEHPTHNGGTGKGHIEGKGAKAGDSVPYPRKQSLVPGESGSQRHLASSQCESSYSYRQAPVDPPTCEEAGGRRVMIRKGTKVYKSVNPCKRGHHVRYVSNGCCVICKHDHNTRQAAAPYVKETIQEKFNRWIQQCIRRVWREST